MDCGSRKLSTSSRHRESGSFLSSLKQLIWSSSENNCEESSDTGSDSDTASSQSGREGSSDDELNQGISDLSVDGKQGLEPGRSVEVQVCVDIRTTRESISEDLSIGEHQEYAFADHHLVHLNHSSSDFDTSGFFLDDPNPSTDENVSNPESELQDADDDDDVSRCKKILISLYLLRFTVQ